MNDDDLHRLLHRADPAHALPALTTARINALTDHAVTTTQPTGTAGAARRRDRRGTKRMIFGAEMALTGTVAAALVVIPLLARPTAPPTALEAPSSTNGIDAACAPVSADSIRGADIAFRGHVTTIYNGIVTMQVLHRYTGNPTAIVTIRQGASTAVDGAAPTFTNGDNYLIAASDTTVLTCGSSGTDTPALRTIYDQAFAQ